MKQFEKNLRPTNTRWLGVAALIGVTGTLGTFSQAAPQIGESQKLAPKVAAPVLAAPAEVPAGNGNNTRREERQRQRQAEQQQRREELQNMTPEERQKAMQERMTTGLRRQVERAGVTDTAKQDAIIAFLQSEQTARAGVREAANKLQQGLRSNAITDAQVGVLLNDFRDAVDAEKSRRASAAKELDAQVGYSKNPRLEAALTMMGAIGEESNYLAPMGMGGGRGRGAGGGFGMGGFGGANGMGNNQRGGQNGRNRNRPAGQPAGQPGAQTMDAAPVNPAP